MMKRFFIFILLIFNVLSNCFAQKNVDPKFKSFGKITDSDFAATDFDNVDDYKYILLQNERNMYFDIYNNSLKLFNSYFQRYKILKHNPFPENNLIINYSGKNDFERCIQIKAFVFRKNGSKITTIKLKSRQISYKNSDSLVSEIYVNFPELLPGDIVDFQYIITSFDFVVPPMWNFCADVPCLASRFVCETPNFMQYQFIPTGIDNNIIHNQSNGYVYLNYLFSPQDNPNSLYYMQGRARRFALNFKFNSNVDTFKVYNTFPEENVDFQPVKNYGYPKVLMRAAQFTQNIGYSSMLYQAAWQQLTHLLYTYADVENRYLSQSEAWFKMYNAGYVIVGSNDWEKLYKRLKKSPNFGKPLLKSFILPDSLNYIFNDENVESLDKLIKIYDFVRFNICWDSTYSNCLKKSPEEIIKSKIGNSAEINMTLVSLLRREGFSAYPVLASTRDNQLVDSLYANVLQFNTVLSAVEFNDFDNPLIMDASHIENCYNVLNKNDKNNMCWAVAPDNCFMLDIDNSAIDSDFLQLNISKNNNFLCSFKNLSDNNFAEEKIAYCYKKTENKIFNDFYNFDIQKIDVDKNKLLNGIFSCKSEFYITQNQAQQPFKLFFNKNPFADDFRSVPVDFVSPKKISMEVVTDNYSQIPENKVISNADKTLLAHFYYNENIDGTLTLKFDLQILKPFFNVEEYFDLKKFFDSFYRQLEIKI